MKRTKRILALALAALLVVTVLPAAAFASTASTTFTNFKLNGNKVWYLLSAREKEDSTPLHLYMSSCTENSLRVAAFGRDQYEQKVVNGVALDYNCTYYAPQGQVAYVTCLKNTQYSIQSLVYEDGHPWATLGFHTTNPNGATVSGYWSPDSTTTYTIARP